MWYVVMLNYKESFAVINRHEAVVTWWCYISAQTKLKLPHHDETLYGTAFITALSFTESTSKESCESKPQSNDSYMDLREQENKEREKKRERVRERGGRG